MLVGFCALVLRSEFPQVNAAPVTHPCGRALFVTAGCSAGVSHTLIFVLAVPVFESIHCSSRQCRSAHNVCTFTGLPHQHWTNSR